MAIVLLHLVCHRHRSRRRSHAARVRLLWPSAQRGQKQQGKQIRFLKIADLLNVQTDFPRE